MFDVSIQNILADMLESACLRVASVLKLELRSGMGKKLSEMTLEELWTLFPVILSDPKEYWNEWYSEEEKRLKSLLPCAGMRLSHIGSTAIHDIQAKPIIDILLEIPESGSMEAVKKILTGSGYICMSEAENRKSFNRGYTSDGFAEKVFHLHLRCRGDNDELYFRDYLNEHTGAAREYEALKRSLQQRYEHNRDAYTEAKTDFVRRYTEKAKEVYDGRYL